LYRQKADLEVIAFVEFDVERRFSGFAVPAQNSTYRPIVRPFRGILLL